MINEQIEFLTKKIEVIEKLLEGDITQISKSAIKQAEQFPAGATNQAGVAVEAILYHIYQEKASEAGIVPKEKIILQELKGELGKLKAGIPETILRNIDLIQTYRNLGSHYQKENTISEVDLSSVLNSLVRVVEWYLEYSKGLKPDYSSLQNSVKEMEYTQLVRFTLMDGVISKQERISLDQKKTHLGISDEKAMELEKAVASEVSIQSIQKHFILNPRIKKVSLAIAVGITIALSIYFVLPSEVDQLEKKYIAMDCPDEPLRRESKDSDQRIRQIEAIKSNSKLYPAGFMKQYLLDAIRKCEENALAVKKIKDLNLEGLTLKELKEFFLKNGPGNLPSRKMLLLNYDKTFGEKALESAFKKEMNKSGETLSKEEIEIRMAQYEEIYKSVLVQAIVGKN